MTGDPWLERWLPLIAERAAGTAVLELGCGGGRDTQVLANAGHRVVALDQSPGSIARARTRVPGGKFHCQDLRSSFPVPPGSAGVVLASLSLHYFPWPETLAIAARIGDCLRAGGVLLCRLNSTRDENYGAAGHPEIAENYYMVDGEPKRFFDRQAVLDLFAAGWKLLSIDELTIDRYAEPKIVWEAIVEREG